MYKKVMILSENTNYFYTLESELESRGIEVAVAPNGAEAFNLIMEDVCDLLLVDISPPKLDSLIICKMLRIRPAYRNIPIIIVSTEVGENVEIVCNRSGANDLMKKPGDPMDILPAILKYLGR